jgi:ABC-type transport system substrate-binding protein
MKLSTSSCLAVVSIVLSSADGAAARPRYGGTLRVVTAASMRTLNPAAAPLDDADAAARRLLFPLIFETLVAPDPAGGLRGVLAVAWESRAGDSEWRFQLRRGVRLHDSTPLDSTRIAAALRAIEPRWQVGADAGSITIVADRAMPDLPWQLAEVRYAIAFARPGGGEPIGSGPFAIERWEPKRLRLRAHENHWRGRAFVDAVHVEMGRPLAGQIADLEVGRTDFAALDVQDVRRVSTRGLRVVASAPRELVALVFPAEKAPHAALAQALSHAVDRQAMWSALLQRQGAPAVGVLPGWMSGYAGLLSAPLDRVRARSLVDGLPRLQRILTLRVVNTDPLLRSIAERIAVDAHDVGLTVEINTTTAAGPRTNEVRLMRTGIDATTPERALSSLLRKLGIAFRADGPSLEALYRAEQRLLSEGSVVPLVHVPELYAAGPRVDNWNEPMVLPWGTWSLADIWLKATP